MNSSAVLDSAWLVLYPLNKATLIRWYKNTQRLNEVECLLQGTKLPQPRLTAAVTLPPAQQKPITPPEPPPIPHTFPSPEDTAGQAKSEE